MTAPTTPAGQAVHPAHPVHPVHPVTVRGGTGSIETDPDALVALARSVGAVAEETARSAVSLHGCLLDASDIAALLDPIGWAQFEAQLLDALDAPGGLSWVAARAAVLDAELRVAAASYRAADDLGDADAALGLLRLPTALGAGTAALLRTGSAAAAAQAALAADPQVADTVIDVLAVPALLSAAAAIMPDGHGIVCAPGIDSSRVARTPPRTLTDVVADLGVRNADPRHGEIDVRILTGPDGSRAVIVDVTGTKSWDVGPTRDITSMSTNGRALTGRPTAYEQGVLKAMRLAGVRPSDDVLLVGHSEGGLVAVTAARDAVVTHQFHVTHVLTVGSPIALSVGSVPRSVNVLALENGPDVVPHLDGAENPAAANITTVTSNHGDHTVLGDHDIGRSYLPVAADAQASDNPSIRAYLRSARPFFSATRVETHTYQIQRR